MKRKISLYLFTVLCTSLISGCSSSDNSDEDATKLPSTTTINVGLSNKNMPTKGILTFQYADCPVGSELRNLVDNNANTKFSTSHNSFWLVWKGTERKIVNRCRLTATKESPEKDPKSWQLSASNDSINWTVLYTRNNYTFKNRSDVAIDTIKNETGYLFYKLVITSNNGSPTTEVAEWNLDYSDYGNIFLSIDDLVSYESGSSHSDLTPMGNHYANRHITTDDDKVWLSTASNEPTIPSDMSSMHLNNFKVTLYPYGTPKPADVNQHSIGDCSALAVFASMAYVHPDFVKSLITDNGDGTYNVKMFDPQGKAVTVAVTSTFLAGSDNKISAVSGKNNIATWATILEKAIMKWNTIYQVNTSINGIGSEHVAPLFTGDGESFAFSPGKLTGAQLARVVKWAMAKGKICVGGFNKELYVGNLRTVTGHAWTLMIAENEFSLFAMRNPWGFNSGGDGSDDGVLNIPLTGEILSTIDFRIIDPGIAGTTGLSTPYEIPRFSVSAENLRVDKKLLHGMFYKE